MLEGRDAALQLLYVLIKHFMSLLQSLDAVPLSQRAGGDGGGALAFYIGEMSFCAADS
jgi:hypothetical protein